MTIDPCPSSAAVCGIAPAASGAPGVVLSDGRVVLLESFRDDCHARAGQLRDQAIEEFVARVGSAVRGIVSAARRRIRATAAGRARVPAG